MDYLFPEFCVPELAPFVRPTNREVQDWLAQTRGMLSNELRHWAGLVPLLGRRVLYTGPLTLAQQWWIYCELNDDSKY